MEARYEYSYGRQNWFEYSAAGTPRAVRENVALFDQSSFAKYPPGRTGRGAGAELRVR